MSLAIPGAPAVSLAIPGTPAKQSLQSVDDDFVPELPARRASLAELPQALFWSMAKLLSKECVPLSIDPDRDGSLQRYYVPNRG